ncbi:MAG: segregation ATPase FtsK/SpoIIIE, family [Blastocatellia bacterium]|jgi:S-DNA-T family DNA segregation ATPase FtsK/SpoIIIE|nr:segregation ATPase FtsK/SpoIIIE, family [Blastocatellia bacterium]
MATLQTDAQSTEAPRNTRRNEIIAIGLLALGLLLALCLASYNPNDPSWNAAGQNEARNLVGVIGANVAAVVFQSVGLASYLLPLLLLAAAWRRFRTRKIHAPWSRMIGLVILVLASAALITLSNIRPLFDSSFHPGGLAGTVIAQSLASGLNTVGAAVLLVAIAATGLLLATNFSFARVYESILAMFGNRFAFFRSLPQRFTAWRQQRQEKAALRSEMRRSAQAERQAAREALADAKLTPAQRVARFMEGNGETHPEVATVGAPRHSDTVPGDDGELAAALQSFASTTTIGQKAAAATAGAGAGVDGKPGSSKRSYFSRPGKLPAAEAAVVEEMVKDAAVKRIKADEAEAAAKLPFDNGRAKASVIKAQVEDYKLPYVEFLNAPPPHREQADDELLNLATRLAEKCREFNVTGQIKHICPGPVVTTYEFKPDPGVKYARVTGLVDDLCLAMKAESIRIDRMPGKPHVGIEVPNPRRETIHLREVIESRAFRESTSKLTIALGKTIDGLNYVTDLAKMPHLLIAGTTGAGKSVGVNALLLSILYNARPDEVKFILIDPKRLELGLYEDIPHLATPIITDPKLAARSLRWAVAEMERRYKQLAGWGVRNIDGFNMEILRRNTVKDYDENGEPWKPLPFIVIIIDELADLMMVSGHEVEESITRLAQMARAVGIHLVLATQRPSVDVITGLIKANFPSRISYRVSSKVDSRTILDTNGAEQLLGRGDMLFLPPGTSRLVRVHGAYVDEAEIGRIVTHIKSQWQPDYDESITQSEDEALGLEEAEGERDDLFEDALRICVEMKRASTSVLQRRLRIGYGRAAAILDVMEREGFIGQADGARPRPVLGRAYEVIADWDEAPVAVE